MMRTRRLVLFMPVVVVAAAAAFGLQAQAADVVRCTEAGGRIIYTDGPCPPGSQLSRQVPISEPLSVVPAPGSAGEARRPAATPPPPATPAAPPAAAAPQGPAIIPRYADERGALPPPEPPVYGWGPDPYYDGGRPIVRPPRPPRPVDPGPPPGKRPCANLAGIQRGNC
jgi:hypothetical protein